MSQPCARHPSQISVGVCKRCGNGTCTVCSVHVDGAVYCSVLCFTEHSVSTKRRTLREEPSPEAGGTPKDSSSSKLPKGAPSPSGGVRKGPDPLSDIDLASGEAPRANPQDRIPADWTAPESPIADDSIVVKPDSAIKPPGGDESVVLSSGHDTSVLDMRAVRKQEDGTYAFEPVSRPKPPEKDESSIQQINPAHKDHTSILGLHALPEAGKGDPKLPPGSQNSGGSSGSSRVISSETSDVQVPTGWGDLESDSELPSWMSDAAAPAVKQPAPAPEPAKPSTVRRLSNPEPSSESSIPIVIPGTRRSTIEYRCVFHPETPAIQICAQCSDPICSMCVVDDGFGGRCTPRCRQKDPIRRRNNLFWWLVSGTVAAAIPIVLILTSGGDGGKSRVPIVVSAAPAIPEPPPLSPPPPRVPPKGELPKPEPPKPVVVNVEVPKVEPPKPAPLKAEVKLEPKPEPPKPRIILTPAPAFKTEPPSEVDPVPAPAVVLVPKPEFKPAAKIEAKREPPKPPPIPAPVVVAPAPPKPDPKLAPPEPKPPVLVAPPVATPPAVPPQVPPPPKKEDTLNARLTAASGLIREATPQYHELTDLLDPQTTPSQDVRAQADRVKKLEEKLLKAKREYEGVLERAPDKEVIGRRIDALGELIDGLSSGMDRVKADRMRKQAALRIKEATPLFQRFSSRFPEATEASEREVLLDLASIAREKLREARSLYAEIEASSPSTPATSSRISAIDRLIEPLDQALAGASQQKP
jgi:hypothetical protein